MKRGFYLIILLAFLTMPHNGIAKQNIIINIPTRTLELHEDGKFIKQYPIAVGKPSYNSPIGHYSVVNKAVNPIWRPKGKNLVYPGPQNPLGTRWIGFLGEYGIHGNNNPTSIGTFASKGCIRMFNYDVEELYNRVKVSSDVDIYYNTVHIYDNLDKAKAALVVFPDLYNKKVNKIDTIKQKLEEYKILEQIPEQKINNLCNSINKNTTIFTKNWAVCVNNEYLSSDTKLKTKKVENILNNEEELSYQEQSSVESKLNEQDENIPKCEDVLININTVNWFFGVDLKLNDEGKLIYDNRPIYYELFDNILYVSVLDCIRTIEGYYNINEEQERINWFITYGKLDNKFFRLGIKTDAYNVYASLRDITNALGLTGEWNNEKGVFVVNDIEMKGKIIGERMYVTLPQIKDYFGLESNYFSFQNKLELYSPKI